MVVGSRVVQAPYRRRVRETGCGDAVRGGTIYTLIGVLIIILVMTLLVLLVLASIDPRFPEDLL
jgi:hypothetical protein